MFLFTLWRSHGYSENLIAFPQPVNLGDPLMQLWTDGYKDTSINGTTYLKFLQLHVISINWLHEAICCSLVYNLVRTLLLTQTWYVPDCSPLSLRRFDLGLQHVLVYFNLTGSFCHCLFKPAEYTVSLLIIVILVTMAVRHSMCYWRHIRYLIWRSIYIAYGIRLWILYN